MLRILIALMDAIQQLEKTLVRLGISLKVNNYML